MKKQKKLSTLVLFKPKALKKWGCSLMLEGLLRHSFFFEFNIAELKTVRMTKSQAREFYAEHKGKDFYDLLVNFISSRDVVAIRIEYPADNPDFIQNFRKFVIGATDPNKAVSGTMRYLFGAKKEFAEGLPANGVHASDSRESAKRELAFFFDGDYECGSPIITQIGNFLPIFSFVDFLGLINIFKYGFVYENLSLYKQKNNVSIGIKI